MHNLINNKIFDAELLDEKIILSKKEKDSLTDFHINLLLDGNMTDDDIRISVEYGNPGILIDSQF